MDNISIIGAWLLCAVAAERVAELVVDSKLLAPVRNMVALLAVWRLDIPKYAPVRKPFKFMSDLVSCGWCTSAWTALLFSMFLPGENQFFAIAYDNVVVKWFALFGFANLFHALFRLVHHGDKYLVGFQSHVTHSNSPQQEPEQQETFELSAEPKNGV